MHSHWCPSGVIWLVGSCWCSANQTVSYHRFLTGIGCTKDELQNNSSLFQHLNLHSKLISNSITNNILNITNLEDDLKKEIVEKTEIKINILHPDAQHNLICYGKITDLELKINM